MTKTTLSDIIRFAFTAFALPFLLVALVAYVVALCFAFVARAFAQTIPVRQLIDNIFMP